MLSLILEKCHVDNRLTFVIGVLLTITGAALIADWQSVRGDPCNQLNENVTLCRPESSGWLQEHNITVQFSAAVMIDTTNQTSCLQLKRVEGTHFVTVLASRCEDDCHDGDAVCELVRNTSHSCALNTSQLVCAPLNRSILEQQMSVTFQCLWPQRAQYMRLQVAHDTAVSWLLDDEGSGGGIVNNGTMSNFGCNFGLGSDGFSSDGCMLVVLKTDCESQSSGTCTDNWCTVTSDCPSRNCTEVPDNVHCFAEEHNVNLTSCLIPSRNTTNQSSCVCQAFSSVAGYSCFWNQVSRITGEFCERCPPTCLSETHSLNFVQLIIGLLLFSPGYPIGRLTLTFLLSDYLGGKSQVC